MYTIKIHRKQNNFTIKPVTRQVNVRGKSKRGLKGEQGIQGIDGRSAYQVWLDEGNTGTEQDFFDSLQGEQGDPGEGVPTGGTTGQFLRKTSNTDYATTFANILQSDVQGLVSALSEVDDDLTDLNESISDVGDAVDAIETQLPLYFHKTNDDTDDIIESATKKFLTSTERTKLTGIEPGAQTNRIESVSGDDTGVRIEDGISGGGTARIRRIAAGTGISIGINGDDVVEIENTLDLESLFKEVDLSVTVGSGGEYETINEALYQLSRLKPLYKNDGFTAEISLLSGFVMEEQVLVRGVDFSWITITSADAEVPVDASAITTELIPEDNITPIIGGADNARLPIIGVLFAYPDQGDDYADSPMDGIAVVNDSTVVFKPGAGVKRPRNGLKVLYGSSATCYMPGLTQGGGGTGAGLVTGVDFSYATARALHVAYGSTANLARSQLHHSAGDYGAYIIWGSHVDLYQSQIHDTTNGNAITCRDGSTANMRETNVARSRRGYHALHNSRINARSHTSPSDLAIMWVGDAAKDCTQYGVLASYNSQIDAAELDVSGSVIGVRASHTSTISFTSGVAENCTTIAVNAESGGTVNAANVSADNSGTGFLATMGATINADTSSANSATTDGYKADETSDIQARNSSANDAGQYGFNANRSSRINARGSSATGCVIGFTAYEGSKINAQSTIASGADTWGYSVDRGSEINAGSITGTTNQAINVQTGLGMISDASQAGGDGDTAIWGEITGTLSAQTDLQDALDDKANDTAVVHKTGDETIAGIKTLTGRADFTNASTGIRLYNTADQTTDYERGSLFWNANRYELSVASGGSGSIRQVGLQANDAATGNVRFTLDRNASPFAIVTHSNTSAARTVLQVSGTSTSSSSAYTSVAIIPTITQSSTGSYTALLINPTESSTGNGTKLLINAQVGGAARFSVDNTGVATVAAVGTAAGSLVSVDGTQTLTNKTMSLASNTFSGFTAGSIPFSNGTTLAQSNVNLFWASSTSRLGIRTLDPQQSIHTTGSVAFAGGTNYISVTGTPTSQRTWTFQDTSDTVVGRATTDTLTNKTLTSPTLGGTIVISNAANIVVGTATGTKLGTATNQKLGFFNATPVVQPTGNILTALSDLGLVATPTLGTAWATWTPTFTGFSADPTGGIYRYRTISDEIEIEIRMPNAGTSNADTFTITLPVTAATVTDMVWQGMARIRNNGNFVNAPGYVNIASGGTTMSVFINTGTTVWGTANGKSLDYLRMRYRWQ